MPCFVHINHLTRTRGTMACTAGTSELEKRVVRLEREARVLRRVLALAVLGVLWLVTMGQTSRPDAELRVQRLLVCDSAGRTRAELALADDSSVGLQLRDAAQRPRVSLRVSAAGVPKVELRDEQGHALARLAASPLGGVTMALGDSSGKEAARLGVDAGGVPTLDLVRELPEYTTKLRVRVDRSPRIELHNWDAAPAGMTLHDAQGRVRLSLAATAAGTPFLRLLDANGGALFAAP
jgi:hypothetical protein